MDAGTVRVGVALSDPDGLLATPLETVRRGRGDLRRLAQLAHEHDVLEVVVGLPRSLSGGEGPAARSVREFATALAVRLAPVPVRLVDERLSTVSATRALREAGVSSRGSRQTVDQAAAVVILQHALDLERAGTRDPGETLPVDAPDADRGGERP